MEGVLNLITEYDIFKFYMPDKCWRLNQSTLSPFRNDHNPSFTIGNKHGHLTFIDYGTGERGDCFEFVKVMFHISSMDDVLRKIDNDFGLGITNHCSSGEYKRIISEYKQPEELGKRYSLIQIVTRKFTKEELEYWNSYNISIDDLRANNVYSIKTIYLNKQKFLFDENQIRFGYLYEGGWWKLYFPNQTKKKKWLSNVPLTTAYGLNNLSKDNNTLIVDSLKDFLVCKQIYPYVVHVQNESLAAFSPEVVQFINDNSKEVFYGGDCDAKGKEASHNITKTFVWKHINPPDRLLPTNKDWSDWMKLEGVEPIKQHFIKKGLYE